MPLLDDNVHWQDFSPSVQKFAPMIEHLSANERFALIKLIMDTPLLKPNEAMAKKHLAPLDVKYFDVVQISDDFDAQLADDFWLGDDL